MLETLSSGTALFIDCDIVVLRMCKKYGFREVGEDCNWNLYWSDGCLTMGHMMGMKKFQVSVKRNKTITLKRFLK